MFMLGLIFGVLLMLAISLAFVWAVVYLVCLALAIEFTFKYVLIALAIFWFIIWADKTK